VDAAISGYEELRQRLALEGAGDPSTYGELVQRRQAIEARLQDFESRRKQVESVRREADSCLAGLLTLRRELTERRKKFIEKVLKGNAYVRIEVTPYGARETVEGEIRALIQREAGGFEKDIGSTGSGDGLLGGLYANSPDARTFEQRLEALKTRVSDIAAGTYNPSDLRDQRFASHLAKLSPETFDRLDTWFPEDTLLVEYSTGAGGASFRSIQEGSPGQKTAALLAFLLSYGEEPIVLDQPEDDLDNHLIYDLIVGQLRSIKHHRQVIVVTHNANVVVNGDAELVVSLAARVGETQQDCTGSLQQRSVRETICAVMEGGREAFEQRYRRISLEARHV
jgi:ATPase subunit of ABC transporter with duplicated ATPase domains